MSRHSVALAICVFLVFFPKPSKTQGLPHHSKISYVPIVTMKVPINDSGISFTGEDRGRMYAGGGLGYVAGIGSAIALYYVLDPLLQDNQTTLFLAVVTGFVTLPPLGIAAGIHISQMNEPHTSKFSCTYGGALFGILGGIYIPAGIVFVPPLLGVKQYEKCAYLREDTREESIVNQEF
jgi:hypothetical protein